MLQFCDAQHDANDEYSQQWYLHPEAQGGIGYCPAHVIEGEYATWTPSVGIVDSGVKTDITDFEIVGDEPRYCRVDGDWQYDAHGTAVFSVLGSLLSEDSGMVGITNNASYRSYGLPCNSTTEDLTELYFSAIDNSDIVVTSQGDPDDIFNYFMWSTVKTALHMGVPFIAAAGNGAHHVEYPYYPARYRESVISVTATDESGDIIRNSSGDLVYNMGDAIDISAPGANIRIATLDPNGDLAYATLPGTSFSSPIVAGAITMLMGVQPGLHVEDYVGFLQAGCTDIEFAGVDTLSGSGRLDIGASMSMIIGENGNYLHSGVAENVVGTSVSSTLHQVHVVGFDEVDDGVYLARRTKYRIEAAFNAPAEYLDDGSTHAWARNQGTTGLARVQEHNADWDRYILNTTMAYLDPASLTNDGCVFETYSYEIYDIATEEFLVQIGPSAGDASVSYAVIGKLVNKVQYVEKSAETGMEYLGTPYSSTTINYDTDGDADMMLSVWNASSILQEVWRFNLDGVPEVLDANITAFPGGAPALQHAGTTVVDYDSDGDEDLFLASPNGAKLYENQGGYFNDVTTSVGLDAFGADTWSGVWGDFDRDNDLDLFLTRAGVSQPGSIPTPSTVVPMTDVLLRNDLNETGLFSDVSADAAGMTTATTGAVSAAWADFDGDGDLDLLVPDLAPSGGGETARLYVNQDNGTFTEDFAGKFSTPGLFSVNGVQFKDLDNDSDLDVVFSVDAATPEAQRVFFYQSGSDSFSEESLGLSMRATGVKVFDTDLDGRQDLLFLPDDPTDTPHLLRNISAGTSFTVKDISADIGLATAGRVDGAIVSDFHSGVPATTTDGDLDLYLGRPDDSEFFFRASGEDGNDARTNNCLALKLETNGANNASCIGARVTVEYDGVTQTQQVDGGSGRGGQDDRVLTFGLGQYSGEVNITVNWPGGRVQTASRAAQPPGAIAPYIITDDTDPVVTGGTLDESCTVLPNNHLEWRLTWETATSSKWDLDMAKVELPGESPFNVSESLGNATVQVWPIVGGGYLHRLTFTTECKTGYYKFNVRSSVTGTAGAWSDQLVKRNDFCPRGSGGTYPEQ